jgi:hypothetical protein
VEKRLDLDGSKQVAGENYNQTYLSAAVFLLHSFFHKISLSAGTPQTAEFLLVFPKDTSRKYGDT